MQQAGFQDTAATATMGRCSSWLLKGAHLANLIVSAHFQHEAYMVLFPASTPPIIPAKNPPHKKKKYIYIYLYVPEST